MKYLEELKEKLCKELEEYEHKEKMTAGDLETIHKLTDTIKNIGKIGMLEEEGGYSERGYSRDGNWTARGMYGDGASYEEGGSSYARGRGRNARRDSMGRYSRDDGYSEEHRGGMRGYGRGYSRADAKDHMIEQIEEMMENANSEKEREALHRCMTSLKNA